MPAIATAKKTEDRSNEAELIQELNTLQDLSDAHRDEYLGSNWFSDVRDIYNLTPKAIVAPSFRPPIEVPQMQVLALQESADLASNIVKVYITGPNGKRDEDREHAFTSAWRTSFVNLHTMYSTIWSMLAGTGFLQCGFDPLARRGQGSTYVRWRDPNTVHPDPAATSEDDWYFVQVTERQWPDEIARRFPRARMLGITAPPASTHSATPYNNTGTNKMQMPPGPMSATGRMRDDRALGPADGRLQVRHSFIWDSNVRDRVKEAAGNSTKLDAVLPNRYELLYPNGRYIVDVEGWGVMADGDNPHPMGDFPLTRVLGMPALSSFWGVPPTRYTMSLQELAVKMMKQVFENYVRVNNVQYFLDEASGLTSDDFAGLPGEIRVINSTGKKPEILMPNAFPAHFIQYPQILLQLQKELWGFTPARQGQQGAGNVGADLFESAVAQAQSLTRLRAMMLACSIQRLAEQFFYTMAKYQGDRKFPNFATGFKLTDWKRVDPQQAKEYEVFLDPSSIQPMSASALRNLVPKLRQMNMIDTRSGLEMLGVPASGEIAEHLEVEKALEALARLKRR